jgi:hypothetical protein
MRFAGLSKKLPHSLLGLHIWGIGTEIHIP